METEPFEASRCVWPRPTCATPSTWDFDAVGQWADAVGSTSHNAWVLWQRLEPDLLGSVYINHVAVDDRPEFIRASSGSNYNRLRELKSVSDPINPFRVNLNIAPA